MADNASFNWKDTKSRAKSRAKSELQLYNEFIDKEARRMMSGNPPLDPNPKVNLEIHKQFAKGEYPVGGSEGKPWLKGKRMRASLTGGLTQSDIIYGEGWQGERKSKRRAAARKAGAPRMSLAQLDRAAMRPGPSGMSSAKLWAMADPDDFRPLSEGRQMAKRQMANKLLQGGGSIRLPQMPKGGMKAMLPLLLLALLAGGMGGGNEDLDGMLG